MEFSKNLQQKLDERQANNTLRNLGVQSNFIDFSSNDYLGFSKSEAIFNEAHQYLLEQNITQNGSTGSRLLSGNHKLYDEVETILCKFHNTEAALVFNSGSDANDGFFSTVPPRGDVLFYDAYSHASIRDGITMSNAKAYKFKHNNLEALEKLILRHSELVSESHQNIYVVTESVFSMDGDSPDLATISQISKTHNAFLIVDEAHALGVFGQGKGLIQALGLEDQVFARLVTFGKGLGGHGAAILGSTLLKQYLVNFARSFIYTTALPPHALATIMCAYQELSQTQNIEKLKHNIRFFKAEMKNQQLQNHFIEGNSAIHCCIISGNNKAKSIAQKLQDNGFDVKPILSPTVPKSQERLRFCLHGYNSEKEIIEVLILLTKYIR